MRVLSVFLFSLLLAPPAFAGDVTGQFAFTKKAPVVALVYFPEDSSAPKTGVHVDQVDKNFNTKLVVAPKGTPILLKNSDTVQHNIFADDKKTGVTFDSGLVDPGSEATQAIDWDEGQIVRIGCKIHPRMSMYGGSISSNFKAVVEFNKELNKGVTITVVPDKLTKVKVWIARFYPQEATLPPGGSATIELTRKNKVYGTLTLNR